MILTISSEEPLERVVAAMDGERLEVVEPDDDSDPLTIRKTRHDQDRTVHDTH